MFSRSKGGIETSVAGMIISAMVVIFLFIQTTSVAEEGLTGTSADDNNIRQMERMYQDVVEACKDNTDTGGRIDWMQPQARGSEAGKSIHVCNNEKELCYGERNSGTGITASCREVNIDCGGEGTGSSTISDSTLYNVKYEDDEATIKCISGIE